MENEVIKEYWDNGQLLKEYSLLNNRIHGQYKAYYENGKINYIYDCKKDLLYGISQFWFNNDENSRKFIRQWKNNINNGLEIDFNYEN
jgi:antitoxin component YwqK of YwqJK toxin-antitoxin module